MSSGYANNQFAALRSLKRVRRPAGSTPTGLGNPRLSEAVLAAAGSETAGEQNTEQYEAPSRIDRTEAVSPKRKRVARGTADGQARDVPMSTVEQRPETFVSNGVDLCIVRLKADESVCFNGVFDFAVLKGTVQVYGHTFHSDPVWSYIAAQPHAAKAPYPGLDFVQCYSPTTHALPVFRATQQPANQRSMPPSISMSEANVDQISLASVQKLLVKVAEGPHQLLDETLLLIRAMSDRSVVNIGRRVPGFAHLFRSKDQHTGLLDIPGVYPLWNSTPELKPLIIPKPWEDVTEGSLSESDGTPDRSVHCVVGSKNMGKSTFARYLVNKLLNRYERVAYLDCDLGQSEFTPAGIVSLHVITRPLLGPPFTLLRDPYQCYFIGSSSPKEDTDHYLACLRELVNVYDKELLAQDDIPVPLVINTHGWVKGMGLDLLVHFLLDARPSRIYQLGVHETTSYSSAKNINVDLKAIVNDMCGGGYTGQVLHIPTSADLSLPRQNTVRFGASELRHLSLLSYFHQSAFGPSLSNSHSTPSAPTNPTWNFDESLTAQLPYEVPFQTVRIMFPNAEVPFSQTLHALNGCIVGLVIDRTEYAAAPVVDSEEEEGNADDTETETTTSAASSLRIIPPGVSIAPHRHYCVGLGLIRGIDPVRQVFHVLTGPIPAEHLSMVNTLVRGPGYETPVGLFGSGYENSRAHLPYTSRLSSEGFGSLAWRTRHNLLRKRPRQL
ncbi:Pre-mRNA cleavage complex II protein Clp1-domain-containing protein [Fimicolochytrium jonesii]|uniref:Pre-mRNA cleavage complex II protein Clp1-domain-containing protein n=1 Tax=Fimicolochytrium jonesii TaxID=1396493 RepID=UPI0022FDB8C1|nr:Pre-mRNA cleavage complex II protein Clp1-domain-containing protein [Fimicolochytrium jonesii]KAI8822098.1 Pre-mRNA cleavage complex II protein Clp1-domain-containing protein [Fimicolochytrium jonesii]